MLGGGEAGRLAPTPPGEPGPRLLKDDAILPASKPESTYETFSSSLGAAHRHFLSPLVDPPRRWACFFNSFTSFFTLSTVLLAVSEAFLAEVTSLTN